MGELLSDVGDLVFSLVIGYIGALEFLYVVRHLYHWTFRHPVISEAENNEESLKHLQDNVRSQLAEAESKESQVGGINVMQDGVLYKDGFRVEPQQRQEDKEQRRKEIEAELAKQQKIEEETRAQLAKAEAELEKQRLEAAALAEQQKAEQKLLAAERAREEAQAEEERQRAEEEECARRILEAEQQREAEQRQLEEEKELTAQREREEQARLEEQENAKRILEAEHLREETERLKEQAAEVERLAAEREQKELEENIKRLLEAEQRQQEEQRAAEEAERIKEETERLKEQSAEIERLAAEREQKEIEENIKRLLEAEQRQQEEQRAAEEAERIKEETERLKQQAAEKELLAVEREQKELEENIKRLLEAELRLQEEQRAAEEAIERELLQQQSEDAELSEQAHLLLEAEREQERKQKIKEENARKFLEAEEKMVAELQRQKDAAEATQQQHTSEEDMLAELERQMDAAETMQKQQHTSEQDMLAELDRQMETAETMQQRQLPTLSQQISVVEEPCVKKNFSSLAKTDAAERLPQTVKTQFGQTGNESYSLSTKSLHFPGAADDTSSIEPTSSQQSSFSTQPSDEITTGTEDTAKAMGVLGIDIELEREAPDGEDNAPDVQYTDEYLRSLDGIKQRPLVREDGSGRRRAFKKRRSSGSSNSSRDSRVSREEEIKMFTSLEEEEMDAAKKGEEDFAAIKYSGESTLKVKGHHRRHKRSPAKDAKPSDEKSSLEMLDEENSNPWGELVPEHYKDTAFWKREKAISIDEEDVDLVVPVTKRKEEEHEEVVEEKQTATHIPKASSFEDASDIQNKEALSALQQQHTKGIEDDSNEATGETRDDENKNLKISQNTEGISSPARSNSPRLRRSPRIDEIDQYEERWKETVDKTTPATVVTPTITLDTAPWRDDHGFLLEGLSDFYDFTASINPSRSRSTSRAATPTIPKPSTTFPKNISCSPLREENNDDSNQERRHNTIGMIELYDDAGNFEIVNKGAVMEFVESLSEELTSSKYFENAEAFLTQNLKNIADEPEKRLTAEIMPTILIEATDNDSAPTENTRYLSRSRSRSRSRSPLPTADNIQRSLETRRSKLIQHNDEIFEKLKETVPDIALQLEQAPLMAEDIKSAEECSKKHFKEDMNLLVDSLRAERCRSRSRSPLPTTSNIQRSLEARREKLIQHNAEIFQTLEQSQAIETKTVETPTISVELIDNTANMDVEESTELSEENMAALVETLRIARSKSHSRTPMRVEIKYVYEFVESPAEKYKVSLPRPRSRSVTPSRSPIIVPVQEITSNDVPNKSVEYEITDHPTPNSEGYVLVSPETLENLSDYYDFHQMLNLEASYNKTLSKNTEEIESSLALKRRSVDEEALDKLRTANEEIELRSISPTRNVELSAEHDEFKNLDKFEHTIDHERLRQLKCTPTTPDYDRTISKEWQDVQRIKEEIITSGYKRSTYVGESLDIGSEFEDLRREAAEFQRSQSRSRSPECIETDLIENARKKAADARQIQNDILVEITATSKDEESRGAKPKTSSYERSLSKEIVDTQRIKEAMLGSGFQRSTYVGESLDMSAQFEDLRRTNAEFRRSKSKSRSPPDAREAVDMARITAEVARRELQDRILDEIERTNISFQDFSRNLNADFLDSERRASDTMLIQRPEIIFQFEDTDFSLDLEPEEYHHYRRYSLYQEPPIEEYPSDDYSDYMYVSDASVFTEKESASCRCEDYNSDNFEQINIEETNVEIASNLSLEVLTETKGKEDTIVLHEVEVAEDEESAVLIEKVTNESNKEDEVATAPQEKVNDFEVLHADVDVTTCLGDKDVNSIGEDEVTATLQEDVTPQEALQTGEESTVLIEKITKESNKEDEVASAPQKNVNDVEVLHADVTTCPGDKEVNAIGEDEVTATLQDDVTAQEVLQKNEESTVLIEKINKESNKEDEVASAPQEKVNDVEVLHADVDVTICPGDKDVNAIGEDFVTATLQKNVTAQEALQKDEELIQKVTEESNKEDEVASALQEKLNDVEVLHADVDVTICPGDKDVNAIGEDEVTATLQEDVATQEALQKDEELIEKVTKGKNKEDEVASILQEKVNDVEVLHADVDATTCPGNKDVNAIGEDEVTATLQDDVTAQEALQKDEESIVLIEKINKESNKEDEVASAPQEKVNDVEVLHADVDVTTCPGDKDVNAIGEDEVTATLQEDVATQEALQKDKELNEKVTKETNKKDEVASAPQEEVNDLEVLHAEEDVTTRPDNKVVNAVGEDEVLVTLQEDVIAAGPQGDEDLEIFLEDEDTDGSEDERRTVVDVEDEIEEDIGDFTDRGPTDESHHEQSECEEADREIDRYADRRADDWQSIEEIDNLLGEPGQEEEGATGGSGSVTYDSDSFAIDQIYDEAIRNRKQSGILRDYDCILQDMQQNFIDKATSHSQLSTEGDHYALWAKTRDLERYNSQHSNGVESSVSLIESERNDNERRYLGDATVSARSATRLRSRYGYVPMLQTNATDEIEVDLNYKPKREYNWRKNFKLDEEQAEENTNNENKREEIHVDNYETIDEELFDARKYSLGGESITLFSRSPERELLPEVVEEETLIVYAEQEIEATLDIAVTEVIKQEQPEEQKQKTKKKSKKKTRKESKGSIEVYPKDDDDSENQVPYEYSRRSSSLQMETDSPKRKSRSRRSSRSSLVNEDSIELFSPRSSIGYAEPLGEFNVEYEESNTATSSHKKKTKKRKKAKETFMHEPEIKEEHSIIEAQNEILTETLPVSAAISPNAANRNVLSMLSPENSVCVTPASIESDTNNDNESGGVSTAITTSSTTPTTTRSTINSTAARIAESFDFLKDGNFYPLF